MILNHLPAQTVADLAWLGKDPSWIGFEPWTDARGHPCSRLRLNKHYLDRRPDVVNHRDIIDTITGLIKQNLFAPLAILEAAAALAANGPKEFRPTEEQWESMEQVELRLPVRDFTSPFPAIIVRVPPGCRARLAKQFGVYAPHAPTDVLVRWRHQPGENPMVITHSGEPMTNAEVFYIFQEQPGNATIEDALARDVSALSGDHSTPGLFKFGVVADRAALNLCLLLTHVGCDVRTPPKMNRRERRAHTKHGDVLTVTMRQNVIVRAPSPPTTNPQGPGTGIEMRPHWRKGHWRCYPGQAALRAAGATVPLLFIRPVLVRGDRASGDLAATSTTYLG